MLNLRADKTTRVACSLAVLLLLALQEKVWPWLLAAPADGRTADTQPEQQRSSSTKKTKRLPHIVPDAAAPRWTSGWAQAALRLAVGARDGVVSCGSRRPATGEQGSAALPADCTWAGWLKRSDGVVILLTAQVSCDFRDPAVHIVLLRTGPPAALIKRAAGV